MERKTTAGNNWWDKLGEPKYGGELVIRASRNIVNFDPYYHESLTTIQTAWMEKLHADVANRIKRMAAKEALQNSGVKIGVSDT